jgi:hypothetical protein
MNENIILTEDMLNCCRGSPLEIINYYTVYPKKLLLKYNNKQLINYIIKISISATNYYIKQAKFTFIFLISVYLLFKNNEQNILYNTINLMFNIYLYFIFCNIFILTFSCIRYYLISG